MLHLMVDADGVVRQAGVMEDVPTLATWLRIPETRQTVVIGSQIFGPTHAVAFYYKGTAIQLLMGLHGFSPFGDEKQGTRFVSFSIKDNYIIDRVVINFQRRNGGGVGHGGSIIPR